MILLGLRNIDLATVYHNLIKLNIRYITFQEWNRAGPKNLVGLLKQHFTVSWLKNLKVVEIHVIPSYFWQPFYSSDSRGSGRL